jgi:hypothetical protein
MAVRVGPILGDVNAFIAARALARGEFNLFNRYHASSNAPRRHITPRAPAIICTRAQCVVLEHNTRVNHHASSLSPLYRACKGSKGSSKRLES